MDRKYNCHAWCKLQTSNIKNSFGLGFRTMKCLGHLCCQNDSCPLFQHSSTHNEGTWSGNCLQLLIFGQCFVKSLICTINCKFCDTFPTCLQTCSCKMYYVVHKFPNLLGVAIHFCIHAYPIIDGKCREFF
jgi:hypothetical protein